MMLPALVLASCSDNKESQTKEAAPAQEQEQKSSVDLRGQWYLENIVFDDTTSVRPADETPDVRQYITFTDSTFSIQTNCNSIQGEYKITGDSISIPVTLMTEMACENMATEDALRKVLPDIVTVEMQNDTVVRLGGRVPAECIMLVRAKEVK